MCIEKRKLQFWASNIWQKPMHIRGNLYVKENTCKLLINACKFQSNKVIFGNRDTIKLDCIGLPRYYFPHSVFIKSIKIIDDNKEFDASFILTDGGVMYIVKHGDFSGKGLSGFERLEIIYSRKKKVYNISNNE